MRLALNLATLAVLAFFIQNVHCGMSSVKEILYYRPVYATIWKVKVGAKGEVLIKVDRRSPWGNICTDDWSYYEAYILCRQLGFRNNPRDKKVRKTKRRKIFFVSCNGEQNNLKDCLILRTTRTLRCKDRRYVAGVSCYGSRTTTNPPRPTRPKTRRTTRPKTRRTTRPTTRRTNRPTTRPTTPRPTTPRTTTRPTTPRTTTRPTTPRTTTRPTIRSGRLPDLKPNARRLQDSLRLDIASWDSVPCARDEMCLSSSAYNTSRNYRPGKPRKLLRFSSVVKNVGTADFRPIKDPSQWNWHSCHGHYHSMEAFAVYRITNKAGEDKAEGHKSSFCLEDTECDNFAMKKYTCSTASRYGARGRQGISAGCSDNYMRTLDCQWVDITDLAYGRYTLKVIVNPSKTIKELSYDNNAVHCKINYSRIPYRRRDRVTASDCRNRPA